LLRDNPDREPDPSLAASILELATESFAIGLVLVRGEETLWAEAFGYADKEKGVPADIRTIYRTGSLAKPFTAMAVMQLAEAGDLDIDQPLNAYLPEFSIRSRFDTTAQPITVRSVLSHHSGLPTDLNKGMWTDARFTEVTANLPEEYTAFPPNLVFSYSNIGYTLRAIKVDGEERLRYSGFVGRKRGDPGAVQR
jgi:CubicO group peptidase (beta-lactamase class C family)